MTLNLQAVAPIERRVMGALKELFPFADPRICLGVDSPMLILRVECYQPDGTGRPVMKRLRDEVVLEIEGLLKEQLGLRGGR